jgi:hypothetical protein
VSEQASPWKLLSLAACLLLSLEAAAGEDGGLLIDPTRPAGWRAAEAASGLERPTAPRRLTLQGTFNLEGDRSAVVNGRRVTVGDEIGGARVIDIKRDRVILRLDGERVELASTTPVVKTPTFDRGERR